MKTITITIALLSSTFCLASDPAYDKAMSQSLEQLGEAKSLDDFQNTANSFSRISNVATSDWLSKYYQVHCYVLMSFMEANKSKKDEYLDKGDLILAELLELQKGNSEVFAMQSFWFTARLSVDPATRGQEYMGLSAAAYKKALALNPTNPRALYLQLSNEVGMASFFGKDVSSYCDRILSLLTNWDKYNEVEKLYPSWGKGQVEGMAIRCESTK